ncbi:MAG: hypothetical protein ABI165_17770 [Bryobacteraceae bacterium]
MLFVTVGLIGFAPGLYATALTGNLVLGTPTDSIGVDLHNIDFNFSGSIDNNDTGSINVLGTSTGSFASAGSSVNIADLSSLVVPVGATVNDVNFITFPAQPTWSFTLTELLPGVYTSAACTAAPAPGQTCTPNIAGGSPFNLTNNSTSTSTVSFSFLGTAQDSTTPTLKSNVQGIFSETFSNQNLQQLVSTVVGGGTIVTSYSGTVTASTVPEPGPGSMVLLGAMLIAGSVIVRKRHQGAV